MAYRVFSKCYPCKTEPYCLHYYQLRTQYDYPILSRATHLSDGTAEVNGIWNIENVCKKTLSDIRMERPLAMDSEIYPNRPIIKTSIRNKNIVIKLLQEYLDGDCCRGLYYRDANIIKYHNIIK